MKYAEKSIKYVSGLKQKQKYSYVDSVLLAIFNEVYYNRYLIVNTKLQLHFHEELLINSFPNAQKFGNKKNIYTFVDDWSNID